MLDSLRRPVQFHCSCPLQEHIASILGLPFPSSYVPSLIDSGFHDRMSLLERFHNLMYQFAAHAYITHGVDPLTQKFRRHFGANFPDLKEIVRESPFVFVAVDELVDFPRPVFPNIVYIGGLGVADEMAEATKRPLPVWTKNGTGLIFIAFGPAIINHIILTNLDSFNLPFICLIVPLYAIFLLYCTVLSAPKN